MSSPSATELVSDLTSTEDPALPLDRLLTVLRAAVTGVAFWAAVVLPFLYLPLLVAGLETTASQLAFVALLTLNVLAVVVGHTHRE